MIILNLRDLSGKDQAKIAIPALCEALSDVDADVRWVAAGTLGSLGDEARSAIPALRRLIHDEEPKVRDGAAKALKAFEAIPTDPAFPSPDSTKSEGP